MASNKDLAEEAELLALELGEEVRTEGLKNADLVELVAGLRARLPSAVPAPPEAPPPTQAGAAKPLDGAADDSVGGPPPPAAPPLVQRYPYQVAPGKSLTCSRGVLGPGEEMRDTDVSGGAEQLKYLASRGYLTKR